jgi:hypothetical protein
MQIHDEDEKALIECFRQNRGTLIYFYFGRNGVTRDGLLRVKASQSELKALARLLRSGHVVRNGSGDFRWVSYKLKGFDPHSTQVQSIMKIKRLEQLSSADAEVILERLPERIRAAIIDRANEIEYPIEAVIEMAIASFLDTEALGFADCKPGRGQSRGVFEWS